MTATETRADRILTDAALCGARQVRALPGEVLHVEADWWREGREEHPDPTYRFVITSDEPHPRDRDLLAPIEEYSDHEQAVKRLARYLRAGEVAA